MGREKLNALRQRRDKKMSYLREGLEKGSNEISLKDR